jgi:hypothetical protein
MDETIPDVGFSIIGNIHICITTNEKTVLVNMPEVAKALSRPPTCK